MTTAIRATHTEHQIHQTWTKCLIICARHDCMVSGVGAAACVTWYRRAGSKGVKGRLRRDLLPAIGAAPPEHQRPPDLETVLVNMRATRLYGQWCGCMRPA